jgi:tetratricopeptide (TPR) repeat protein
MPVSSEVTKTRRGLSTRGLQRAVWIALALVVLSLAGFGGYYYWDRYVRLRDRSAIDINIDHLEQAVRKDPSKPETRAALAEGYMRKGLNDKAYEQSMQILKAFPDDQGSLLVAGISAARLRRPEAALQSLQKLVAARRDQPMAKVDNALQIAYYFEGESYLMLNDPADAIVALKGALAISATDADAYYQLGLAYQASSKPKDAVEQFNNAVRFVPDYAEAYQAMIDSYSALGQTDQVTYAKGMHAFSIADYETAKTNLERVTRASPKFAPAFVGLGLTYEKMGQWDQAMATVKQALELQPDGFAAQQALRRLESTINAQAKGNNNG